MKIVMGILLFQLSTGVAEVGNKGAVDLSSLQDLRVKNTHRKGLYTTLYTIRHNPKTFIVIVSTELFYGS